MTDPLPPIPAKRYFTIGEVSDLCGVKQHVLRYWEQEFTQLRPMKRRGNRRYYQHHEVLMVRRIRDLLYDQGFTINGARSQLQDYAQNHASAAVDAAAGTKSPGPDADLNANTDIDANADADAGTHLTGHTNGRLAAQTGRDHPTTSQAAATPMAAPADALGAAGTSNAAVNTAATPDLRTTVPAWLYQELTALRKILTAAA